MADPCPICGHKDQMCVPVERSIITQSGEVRTNRPMRVPRQKVRFGKAGYIGQVEVYDPEYPAINLVQADDDPVTPAERLVEMGGVLPVESVPLPEEKPKRKKKEQ